MSKKMLLMLVIVGCVFGGIWGYHAFGSYMMKQYFATQKEPPVSVSTVRAGTQLWQPGIKVVGDLRAVRGVEISSEAAGQVQAIHFSSGDEVQLGDVLVELNADADRARLKALKSAAELARIVYERDKKQLEVQAVSQAVVDAGIAELKGREAQVEEQEAMIAKKTIRAPFPGKLGISTLSVGGYLNPGETFVTLQAMDPLRVDFFVPQQNLSRLSTGQTVVITTDAHPGREFEGKITALAPRVDKDSRNILVEATVANPAGELLPGMFVSVEVKSGSVLNQVTIPQACVSFNPYGETVFLVEENDKGDDGLLVLKARQTFIKTGETRGDQIAVLEGIPVGSEVVSAGQHKLKNGSLLVISNEPALPNDPAPDPRDE